MIDRLAREVPAEFSDGIVAIEVSPKALPHPRRGDVYTLGECVPLEWSGNGADLQSRIVLYHGSFAALARLGDFDWRTEAWETLAHELRHHLEWRAHVSRLEAYDWAAEENFRRHEGQPFDPEIHEAVDTVEVEPEREGMVTEQYSRGYRLGNQLLRPARVQVGRSRGTAQAAK